MTKPPLMHLRKISERWSSRGVALCEAPLPGWEPRFPYGGASATKHQSPPAKPGEPVDGHGWVHAYTKATCPDCLWMKLINDAEVHLQRQERIMAHYDSVCALIVKQDRAEQDK